MNKYPLIGGSICAVVLLVLASLTNVVGYQTVQVSNQKIINSEIDQKELLFQTLADIANNKDIQRVILGSGITGKQFFDSDLRFSTFTFPVITEKLLKRMYAMGVIFFRTLSKSKIQSLIGRHHVINREIQKELTAVVQKDSTLKDELTQLSNFKCDCEEEKSYWNFTHLCNILLVIDTWVYEMEWLFSYWTYSVIIFFIIPWYIFLFLDQFIYYSLGPDLHCWWVYP